MDLLDDSHLFFLLTFIVLVFLFFCETFLVAFQGLSEKKLKSQRKKNKKRDLSLLENPMRITVTLTILASFLKVFLITYTTLTLSAFFDQGLPSYFSFFSIILLSLPSFFLLSFFIKTLPFYLGTYLQDVFIAKLLPLAVFLTKILSLFYYVYYPLALFLSQGFKVDLRKKPGTLTQEELKIMVEEGEEMGVIEDSQKAMIHNIFQFEDLTVQSIMTHRTYISAINKDQYSLDEIIEIATEGGFSRIPVYEQDIDNIIGVLHVKDLLKLLPHSSQDFALKEFIRSPLYIPGTASCRNLFDQLTCNKMQMAVVIDEYGGTSGIATIEDVLESIVGEIEDEYDESEAPLIESVSEHYYIINGSCSLQELCQTLPLDIPSLEEEEDSQTIGGLLAQELGRIPKAGETLSLTLFNSTFTILHIADNRILKVGIDILPNSEEIL